MRRVQRNARASWPLTKMPLPPENGVRADPIAASPS